MRIDKYPKRPGGVQGDEEIVIVWGSVGDPGDPDYVQGFTWKATLDEVLALFQETDPVFSSSASFGIDSTDINNWNNAYGWGNHADAGYLTSESDPVFTTWISTTPPAYPGDIPTNTSDLDNDSGFITINDIPSETDPDFNAWLSATPPAYPGDIPTALSDLSEDTTHRTVTDTEKFTWNAKLSSETDPLSLHLDQTVPQTLINGSPTVQGIIFNQTTAETNAPGKLWWNAAAKTLSIGLIDGGSFELGQELADNYTFSTGTPHEGDIVSIVTGAGNQDYVALTDATNKISAYTCIGMITSVFNTNKVRVTKIGKIHDVNTNSFTEGDILYVDPANPGKIINTIPTSPNYSISVGVVSVKSSTVGVVDCHISIIPRLQDLSDINGTALTQDGQFAVWNNTTKLFDFTSKVSDFATSSHNHIHNNLDSIEGGDTSHRYHSDQQINKTNDVEFNTIKSTVLATTEVDRGTDSKMGTGIPDIEKKKFKIITSYNSGTNQITVSVAFVGAYTSFTYYINNKRFTVTASNIAAYTQTATAAERGWFFYINQNTASADTPVMVLTQTPWGISDPDVLLWSQSWDDTNKEFLWIGHEKHTYGRDIFNHARNHAQGAVYHSGFLFSQYNGLTNFSGNTDDNFGRAFTQIAGGYFFDEDLKNGIAHSDTAISASLANPETDWDKFVYQFLGFNALATTGTTTTSIVFGSSHTLVTGQAVTVMAGNTTTIRGTTTITTGGTGTTFAVTSVTGLVSGDMIVLGGRIPIYYISAVSGSSYTWRKLSATSFLGVTTSAATWTRSTTTATITATNHGMQTGDKISVTISSDVTSIPLKDYVITRTGVSTFTITCLNAGGASGSMTYYNAYNPTTIASGVAQYNNAVAGLFTTCNGNRYYPMYIAATNFINEPIIAILGQGQSTNATLATALTEAPFQFTNLVGLSGLGIQEIVPIYRLVFHYNTTGSFSNTKIKVVSVTWLDIRVATVSGTIVSGGGTSDHALLTHLDWPNSNHTGTASTIAGFDAGGLPTTYAASSLGVPYFDATVGTGGDYATITLANAASKRVLKQVGNIVETTGDLGTNTFVFGDKNYTITIPAASTGTVKFLNCFLIITGGTDLIAKIELSTVTFSGGAFNSTSTVISNSTIIHNSGLGPYRASISNCVITLSISIYLQFTVNTLITGNYNITNGGYMSNCTYTGTANISQVTMSNCSVLNGTVYCNAGVSVIGSKIKDLTIGTVNAGIVNSNVITGNVVISGTDYNIFTSNQVTGTLTLNSGSEYNIITGNKITGGVINNSGNSTNEINNNIG
jgi:hypothetical protein